MALLSILRYPDPRLHKLAKPVTDFDDRLKQLIADMGKKARAASAALANVPVARKADALNLAAAELRARADDILAANQLDLEAGEKNGLSAAMLDRLRLTPERLEGIAAAVDSVA